MKKMTIIITNKALSKWAEIFNDVIIINAILDRLLHHSHILNIVGLSYQTKDILSKLEENVSIFGEIRIYNIIKCQLWISSRKKSVTGSHKSIGVYE